MKRTTWIPIVICMIGGLLLTPGCETFTGVTDVGGAYSTRIASTPNYVTYAAKTALVDMNFRDVKIDLKPDAPAIVGRVTAMDMQNQTVTIDIKKSRYDGASRIFVRVGDGTGDPTMSGKIIDLIKNQLPEYEPDNGPLG